MVTETSQTLDRGCRVLGVLADEPAGLTVTELAGRMRVNRTVTYRLVSTLELHALVRRDARGRLCLGFGILPLAAGLLPALREVAVPVLRDLAEETGSTALLTLADGEEGLVLAVAEPASTDVHVAYRVGARQPLVDSAAGRAILSARAGDSEACVVSEVPRTGVRGLAVAVHAVDGLEVAVGVVTPGSEIDVEVVGPHVRDAAGELATRLS